MIEAMPLTPTMPYTVAKIAASWLRLPEKILWLNTTMDNFARYRQIMSSTRDAKANRNVISEVLVRFVLPRLDGPYQGNVLAVR